MFLVSGKTPKKMVDMERVQAGPRRRGKDNLRRNLPHLWIEQNPIKIEGREGDGISTGKRDAQLSHKAG